MAAVPTPADTSPDAILRRLAAQCDLMVGVYWTRVGVAAGMPRGSLQAIEQFQAQHRPVVLCLSSTPIPPGVDEAQYQSVLSAAIDELRFLPRMSSARLSVGR
jgi:hypothetical protein